MSSVAERAFAMKTKSLGQVLGLIALGQLLMGANPVGGAAAAEVSGSTAALLDAKSKTEKFGGKLTMQVDRTKVDLQRHRLEVSMNRPVTRIVVKVFGENKESLAEETIVPKDGPVGDPILVRWSQSDKSEIARIELYGYDNEDNWVGVAIVPWNVKIPHEEVHFDTDKATIEKSEVPKLQDSLQRIQDAVQRYRELGSIQLFIAGHTDTVGSAAYNMDLSRRRAQAIAAWFVKNGVGIAVAFEGFGESVPLVETKDEVDEPRNRRVDYILSVEPPAGKAGRAPAWKYLNRAK
jgi:outer membrane protein OmpA-like peptidoglycan-associated protein